eukprot:CAMPEP_0119138796 /NCGR_PEP_ID=MMETSP1310-20130426/26326_1 /TAXON_ID=464262 /ORGANISM="Genus nov. species nov., Strain RCC2339" /LENGTH=1343 /DNA_ID=CAMNT_0007130025 /DNA_START=75 /DNA_END=4106 /DNA_ORIENTATION=-
MSDDRAVAQEEKRAKQKEKEEKWVDSQIVGFTAWLNSYLSKRGKKVSKLDEDLQDGLNLVHFLELASGDDTVLSGIDYAPKGKIQSIQNLSIALKYIQEDLEVRLLGINPGTIYEGNVKMILGMIWSIFRSPKVTRLNEATKDGEDGAKKGKNSFENQLLAWVRERIAPYGLEAKDFKRSFNDGMIFGALIHSIDKDALAFDDLDPKTADTNLEKSFTVAQDSFQVPRLLEVNDMVQGNADERSVVLYTSLLFHAWEAAGAKEADTEIKTKLQKEQEAKEAMEKELVNLRGNVDSLASDLDDRESRLKNLNDEQARLQALVDHLRRRAEAADATIRGLEAKADVLNRIGADSTMFFQGETSGQYLSGHDSDVKGTTDSPHGAGGDQAWTFVDETEDADGVKRGTGNVHIVHTRSEQFLGLTEDKEGGPSAALLSSDLSDTSVWSLVKEDPDSKSTLVKNKKTGEFLTLSPDGSVAFTKDASDRSANFDIRSAADMEKALREQAQSALIAGAFKDAVVLESVQNKKYLSQSGDDASGNSEVSGESEWKFVERENGNVALQNKTSGQLLALDSNDGHVKLLDEDSVEEQFVDGIKMGVNAIRNPYTHWQLQRGGKDNKEIFLKNMGDSSFLKVGADGSVSSVSNKADEAGFVLYAGAAAAGAAGGEGAEGAGLAVAGGNDLSSASGLTLAELEGRRANLDKEIADAERKVADDKDRRNHLLRDLEDARKRASANENRANQAELTVSELEKKINELQDLFDMEQGKKSAEEEARSLAEGELSEKERLLREAEERRERLLRQLERSKQDAAKEIARRKQRDREIKQLQAQEQRLRQEIQLSSKSGGMLDSLKKNLEEHLQDLSVWRKHNNVGANENVFDLKKVAGELADRNFEEQMTYLDEKLADENRCLGRILKVEDDIHQLEDKVVRAGWLQIKGRRDWQPRWCVISGHLLRYYNSEDTAEAADGCVDLTVGCEIVRQKAIKEGKTKVWPLKLTINTKDDQGELVVRKLFLRAASKAERHSWFSAISCATTRINYLNECNNSGERPDTRILAFVSAGEADPVHELLVDHRSISIAGMTALRKGVLYHDDVRTLSLQNASVRDEEMEKLCSAFDKVTDLRVLRLSGNKLGPSVPAILKALCMQNKSLRELDLSDNMVDDSVMEELAHILEVNPNIHTINLTNNVLTSEGVRAFAEALCKHQRSISVVQLGGNKIGDEAVASILELVAASPAINTLELQGNRITDAGAAQLAEGLASNLSVHTVNLAENALGPGGAVAWKACLQKNEDLRRVDLSGNAKLVGSGELGGVLDIEGFTISSLVFQRGADVALDIDQVEHEGDKVDAPEE